MLINWIFKCTNVKQIVNIGGIHCKCSWGIIHRSLTTKHKCPADSYQPMSCAVSITIRRYSNIKIIHKCYTFVNVTNRTHKTNRIVSSCGLQWKTVHTNQFCEPCFAQGDWHCMINILLYLRSV